MSCWTYLRVRRGFVHFGQFVGVCLLLAAVYRIEPVVRYISDASRMRDWAEVPVTVLEAEYRQQGEDGGRQIFASYHYTYGGVEYQGRRVDVAESPEIFGDFQQRFAEELKPHVRDKTPVSAYVNPAQPDESVLDRRLLWTVLAYRLSLFLVLASFGGIILGVMTYVVRRQKYQRIAETTHPNEPWLWRSDWANQLIRSSSFAWPWAFVALAAVYLLVVLPIGILVLREWDREILSVPGVLLILIGLALFNVACWQLKGAGTFKGATFRLSAVPGVIGGSLAGAVVLRKKFPDATMFRVVLECVQTTPWITSSTVNRHPRDQIVWRDSVTVQRTLSTADPYTTAIPVYFAIPFECQPFRFDIHDVNAPRDRVAIQWFLKAGPEADLFDKYAQFEVPVFKTAESLPDFKPDTAVMEPYAKVVEAPEALAGIRFRAEPILGGERLSFSYFQVALLVGALLVLAICAGGVAAIFAFEFYPAWALLPGILGLFILAGTAQMLLWGSAVEIRGDRVTITSGYAGLRKQHDFALSDVMAVDIEKEHSAGQHDFYGVRVKHALPIPQEEIDEIKTTEAPEFIEQELDRLRTVDYVKTTTVIKRLAGRQHAEAVRDWLSKKLRVNDVQPARSIPLASPEPKTIHAEDL
jgi:hypothetical protein